MTTISLDPAGSVQELQVQPIQTDNNVETIVINVSTETVVDLETFEPTTDVDVIDLQSELNVLSQPTVQETTVFPGVSIAAAPLVGLPDVDPTGIENNSLLLYNSTTKMWKPSKKLEDHFINAGQF